MQITVQDLAGVLKRAWWEVPKEVSEETRFDTDLNFDSLDQVEALMEIEDEYGISIDDEEAEKAQTFGQMVELVNKYLENK